MKVNLCQCLIALSIFATGCAGTVPDSPIAEQEVRRFTLACYEAVSEQRWLDNAECYARESLAEFQQAYLEKIETANVVSVPVEFQRYLGRDITVAELKAISPTEFFAAFIGGVVRELEAHGVKQGPLTLEIVSVAKETDEKYHVVADNVAQVTRADRTYEVEKTENITVILRDGRPYFEIPRQMIDLMKIVR